MGKDPIYQVLREHAAESASDILQSVFDSLADFQQGTKKEDDSTAVIVKVEQWWLLAACGSFWPAADAAIRSQAGEP
jgi:serine/threonine protein phosphatase PrpC